MHELMLFVINLLCTVFFFPQDLEGALLDNESVVLADNCARLLRFLTGNVGIL